MLREDLLNTLYAKRADPAEFNFETLAVPSIYNYLSEYELGKMYDITTSKKYSSKVDKKIRAIKDIMMPRGFVGFANGTNRMCFRYLEDKRFIVKVPYKLSGLDNGYREFINQQHLKPFVAKTFEVHPSGIISTHERVLPITNKEEYLSVIDDVFAMLTALMGKYVLEDVGTKYFMNIGIRVGFGVVIIDYPEMFELDGRKLYCNRPIYPNTKFPVCGGLIDFDAGFNTLICTVCGKEYPASALQKAKENKLIIIEGDESMGNVKIKRRGQVVATSTNITNVIVPENDTYTPRPASGAVRIRKRSEAVQQTTVDPKECMDQWLTEIMNDIKLDNQTILIALDTALKHKNISLYDFRTKEELGLFTLAALSRYAAAIGELEQQRQKEQQENDTNTENQEPVLDQQPQEIPESPQQEQNDTAAQKDETEPEAEELKTGVDDTSDQNACSIEDNPEPKQQMDNIQHSDMKTDQQPQETNEDTEVAYSDDMPAATVISENNKVQVDTLEDKQQPKNNTSEPPEQENKKTIREEFVDNSKRVFIIPPGQDISKF